MTHGLHLTLTLGMLTACTAPPTPDEVAQLVQRSVNAMEQLQAEGHDIEAVIVARAITAVDPGRPEALEILAGEPPATFDRGLGGANVRLRRVIEPSWYRRVGLYLPDRIFDLLDTLTVDLHVGPGFFFDVHATRAASIVMGGRSVVGIGGYFDHSFGLQSQTQAGGFVIGGSEVYVGSRVGTGGVLVGDWTVRGVPAPGDRLYQDFRDYWAVGFGTTIAYVGVDSDIHLYQIMDFLVGFVGFDPARDDLATTDALELDRADHNLIQSLGRVARSQSDVKQYRDWLEAGHR